MAVAIPEQYLNLGVNEVLITSVSYGLFPVSGFYSRLRVNNSFCVG